MFIECLSARMEKTCSIVTGSRISKQYIYPYLTLRKLLLRHIVDKFTQKRLRERDYITAKYENLEIDSSL
jgi:hypothetical protein